MEHPHLCIQRYLCTLSRPQTTFRCHDVSPPSPTPDTPLFAHIPMPTLDLTMSIGCYGCFYELHSHCLLMGWILFANLQTLLIPNGVWLLDAISVKTQSSISPLTYLHYLNLNLILKYFWDTLLKNICQSNKTNYLPFILSPSNKTTIAYFNCPNAIFYFIWRISVSVEQFFFSIQIWHSSVIGERWFWKCFTEKMKVNI